MIVKWGWARSNEFVSIFNDQFAEFASMEITWVVYGACFYELENCIENYFRRGLIG